MLGAGKLGEPALEETKDGDLAMMQTTRGDEEGVEIEEDEVVESVKVKAEL